MRALLLAVFLAISCRPAAAEMPLLRVAVLQGGTVNWEMDTITHFGLDTRHGFRLQVLGVAGQPAAQVAFQGDTADAMVSDWIWVARQRAAGRDFVFLPYSRAVGGLMVRAGSGIGALSDLAGQKIGIAGGPLDKSWLILRAYAQQVNGFDLAGETEQVFAAPPLIYKVALDGDLAGAVNFWHFAARMRAAGMTELISVADAATALGLDPDLPLLGYVLKGDLARAKPGLVAGLRAASAEAKMLMATDDAAWERLRGRIRPASDAEFAALRAGFAAGIPDPGAVDPASAARMFALMAKLGGRELVGPATDLPEGVFLNPEP